MGLADRARSGAIEAVRKIVSGYAERGAAASGLPFDPAFDLRPFVGARRYGWTHYGVMIPDLPEPHRYLSVMIMAGMPGHRAFEIDEVVTTSPRDTATVCISTAAEGAEFYRAMSMSKDCVLRANGEDLRFGPELHIYGRFPHISVGIDIPGMSAHLDFSFFARATWFVKGMLYDHLSLLGDYNGWVESGQSRCDISGLGNVEYARSVGPYSVCDKSLPTAMKLPMDFFTYHVVQLRDDSQLLFCRVGLLREPVGDIVLVRSRNGEGDWRVNDVTGDTVFYYVEQYEDEPLTDAGGHRMILPQRFRFGVREKLTVTGTYDCPPRYGVGRGYISGYSAEVRQGDETYSTRGYSEYVDVRKG